MGLLNLSIGITNFANILETYSGIVNVYDRKNPVNESNKPSFYKVLDHLTTSINGLEFSSDGQILAMASGEKRDSFRLVHFPTGSVYKNWPTSSTPLGRISAIKFSPPGSEITIGFVIFYEYDGYVYISCEFYELNKNKFVSFFPFNNKPAPTPLPSCARTNLILLPLY
ncbi:hypothetical protein PCK1_001338 [Pneumocystis canis]|nr:hypothetical protein PCK1_001338 [Pneumocystis canis]